jgi:hypothetical protein
MSQINAKHHPTHKHPFPSLRDRALQVGASVELIHTLEVVCARPDVLDGALGSILDSVVVLLPELPCQRHRPSRSSHTRTFKASTYSWQGRTSMLANRSLRLSLSAISLVLPTTLKA